MGVKQIESLEKFKEALGAAGDKLVVVDFFATWCGPCKMIGPKLEGWSDSDEYKDIVVFLKVDVDEAEDVAAEYDIQAMPTFFFFKGGKKIGDVVGANEKKIKDMIDENK